MHDNTHARQDRCTHACSNTHRGHQRHTVMYRTNGKQTEGQTQHTNKCPSKGERRNTSEEIDTSKNTRNDPRLSACLPACRSALNSDLVPKATNAHTCLAAFIPPQRMTGRDATGKTVDRQLTQT
mmetsp:Transcript_55103/g.107759  ORF Transcript_55103/g.107759 Transcript_55103/m.107759 type:complete len:125 (+) Transcript_55103:489-863(+)